MRLTSTCSSWEESACTAGRRCDNSVLTPTSFLTSGRTKQFVLVTVADTGIGIPENLLLNIFEPFSTTKPIGVGTGLGLSSAQWIVRQHNGHIKAQSVPGAGTKFSIYLPVHQ
jgi:signal transduction histidine kinase